MDDKTFFWCFVIVMCFSAPMPNQLFAQGGSMQVDIRDILREKSATRTGYVLREPLLGDITVRAIKGGAIYGSVLDLKGNKWRHSLTNIRKRNGNLELFRVDTGEHVSLQDIAKLVNSPLPTDAELSGLDNFEEFKQLLGPSDRSFSNLDESFNEDRTAEEDHNWIRAHYRDGSVEYLWVILRISTVEKNGVTRNSVRNLVSHRGTLAAGR